MQDINIRDLMTRDVHCVTRSATMEEVIELMRRNSFSCIVVTEDAKPAGIITERDMVKILSEIVAVCPVGKLYVKDFMSEHLVCLHESATLYEALVISNARKIRHLPVIDDSGKLVGLVTQSDISQAHFVAVEKQRAIIEQEIQDRTSELTEANEELKALALQDSMFRIGNRRAMTVDVHFTHVNSNRYHRPYSVALVDVDCFKRYNDCYGERAGDQALIKVVELIRENLRTSDRLYRYGGEQFLILMPETTLFEAVEAIHRLLENIESAEIPHKKSPFKKITFSAGIGSYSNTPEPGKHKKEYWEAVIAEAATYLDQAKHNGRNQAAWDAGSDGPDEERTTSQSMFGG